jgi:hypothetical protein
MCMCSMNKRLTIETQLSTKIRPQWLIQPLILSDCFKHSNIQNYKYIQICFQSTWHVNSDYKVACFAIQLYQVRYRLHTIMVFSIITNRTLKTHNTWSEGEVPHSPERSWTYNIAVGKCERTASVNFSKLFLSSADPSKKQMKQHCEKQEKCRHNNQTQPLRVCVCVYTHLHEPLCIWKTM